LARSSGSASAPSAATPRPGSTWLYLDVVERRRWIDDAAFLSGLALRWPRLHPLALFAASGALFGVAAVLGG
jgi:hypothetical protein